MSELFCFHFFKNKLLKILSFPCGLLAVSFIIIASCQLAYASYQPPKFICEIFLTDDKISQTSLAFLRDTKEQQPGMILFVYDPDRIENSDFIKQRITALKLPTFRPIILFNGSILIRPEQNDKWQLQCTRTIKQLSTAQPSGVEFSLSLRLLKNNQAEMQFHACNLNALESFSGNIEIWEVWNEKTAVAGNKKQWTKIRQIYNHSIELPPYATIQKCPLPEWLSLPQNSDKKQWQIVGLILDAEGHPIGIDRISAESAIKSGR